MSSDHQRVVTEAAAALKRVENGHFGPDDLAFIDEAISLAGRSAASGGGDPLALVAAMPMPIPAGFRTRYRSEPGMIGHYPWTYADQRRRSAERPSTESEDLFTADQYRAARLEAAQLVLAQGEPVGYVERSSLAWMQERSSAWRIQPWIVRDAQELIEAAPIYAAPAAPVNAEVLDALRLVSMSAGWRYMTHETRAIVQAALDNARAAIASAEAASREAP